MFNGILYKSFPVFDEESKLLLIGECGFFKSSREQHDIPALLHHLFHMLAINCLNPP